MLVTCNYNMACFCEEKEKDGKLIRECATCGWNPDVFRKRKMRLYADQFMKDANAPTRTFFVVGAWIKHGTANPATLVCQKSPQGNFCIKIGEQTLVIPGSTVKEIVNGG